MLVDDWLSTVFPTKGPEHPQQAPTEHLTLAYDNPNFETLGSLLGIRGPASQTTICKLTWLVLGGDPAARPHRVEQLTAL